MNTILLAMPYLHGLHECVETNLRHCGYHVINLTYDDSHTHYPNFLSKIKNLYHKKILKQTDYQKQLRYYLYQNQIAEQLGSLKNQPADYALCIRANIYPHSIMQQIRQNSRICVNYQWDGMARYPDIVDYVAYFDRFFVFDRHDIAQYPQYHFQAACNFYFDYLPNQAENSDNTLYFLGGYEASRTPAIRQFIEQAQAIDLPLDFTFISKHPERVAHEISGRGIQHLAMTQALSFADNLKKSQQSKVLVDFVIAQHQGLSFRVLEAVGYRKKLITTNPTVAEYDFYHPNNILIWQQQSASQLQAFLDLPYHHLPSHLYEKYSFSNWLRYVLDTPPYQILP